MIGSAEMVAYGYGADYGSYCAAWEDGACKPDSDPDCQAGPGHKCGTRKDCKALWETYTNPNTGLQYDFNQDQTWCCDAWCYVNSTTCDAAAAAKYGIEVKASWLGIPGLFYSYSACGYDQNNAVRDPNYEDQSSSDATMDGSFPKSFPDEMTASNFCRHAGASACTQENADTTGITSQCWSYMKSYCAAVAANDRACTHDCDNVNFTAANPETMVDPKCKLALGMPCAKSYATYTSTTKLMGHLVSSVCRSRRCSVRVHSAISHAPLLPCADIWHACRTLKGASSQRVRTRCSPRAASASARMQALARPISRSLAKTTASGVLPGRTAKSRLVPLAHPVWASTPAAMPPTAQRCGVVIRRLLPTISPLLNLGAVLRGATSTPTPALPL